MVWIPKKKSDREKYEGGKRYRFKFFAVLPRRTEEGAMVWFETCFRELERYHDNTGWYGTMKVTYHLTDRQKATVGLKW